MVAKQQPIGVMDSGLGGLSVVHVLRKQLPHEDILYYGDSAHNPYGLKSKQEILQRCIAICDHLVKQGAKAIVIACNTATSACVLDLRKRYSIPIIGMEPALKPAASIQDPRHIAVWATELTLKEEKFDRLLKKTQAQHEIDRVACSSLVELVETGRLFDEQQVDEILEGYLKENGELPERIVLGCTHFYFFRSQLARKVPQIELFDGHEGTVAHLKDILQQRDLLNEQGGKLILENSREDQIARSKVLLDYLEETDGSEKR